MEIYFGTQNSEESVTNVTAVENELSLGNISFVVITKKHIIIFKCIKLFLIFLFSLSYLIFCHVNAKRLNSSQYMLLNND